ncbi:MAG: hypothetical protein IT433_12930 [Phycisphaerales bacterium]|nr:hypothetical protein [Phycisphaerales bacterium]
MKFRKKPVVIDAVQWWPPGDHRHVPIEGVERGPREDQPWGVATLEGFHVASPGDWIITGVKGERYPCKPDVFAATYELAESNPPESGGFVDLEGDAVP